jgi:hypothetical protein
MCFPTLRLLAKREWGRGVGTWDTQPVATDDRGIIRLSFINTSEKNFDKTKTSIMFNKMIVNFAKKYFVIRKD